MTKRNIYKYKQWSIHTNE